MLDSPYGQDECAVLFRFMRSDITIYYVSNEVSITAEEVLILKELVETNQIKILESDDPGQLHLHITTTELQIPLVGLRFNRQIEYLMKMGVQKVMEENALILK